MCLCVASGVSSLSKAKSQTFDPFADLATLSTNLPGKHPGADHQQIMILLIAHLMAG